MGPRLSKSPQYANQKTPTSREGRRVPRIEKRKEFRPTLRGLKKKKYRTGEITVRVLATTTDLLDLARGILPGGVSRLHEGD